jgi:hypothetical protein
VRHKLVNTLLSQRWIQDGVCGTHVTHFVQLYPNHYILRARCVRKAVHVNRLMPHPVVVLNGYLVYTFILYHYTQRDGNHKKAKSYVYIMKK